MIRDFRGKIAKVRSIHWAVFSLPGSLVRVVLLSTIELSNSKAIHLISIEREINRSIIRCSKIAALSVLPRFGDMQFLSCGLDCDVKLGPILDNTCLWSGRDR
jgi:hypothetical protein